MATLLADIPVPSIEGPSEVDQRSRIDDHYSPSRTGGRSLSSSTVVLTPTHSPDAECSGSRSNPPDMASSAQSSPLNDLANMRLSTADDVFNMDPIANALSLAAHVPGRRASSSPNIYEATPRFSPPLSEIDATPRHARQTLSPSPSPSPQPQTNVSERHHQVDDEDPPPDAVHSDQFQQAFRDSKIMMDKMRDVLQTSFLHVDPDSTIHRLHQQASGLASFQYPSTKAVGLVGDSGVGKSSLLNSLLDTRSLARTSNSGEACTCVVTEYHYHHHDFMNINVELFTEEELCTQISLLLQSYRHFHMNQDEIDGEEKRDGEKKARLARDTFHAMFRGRLVQESFLLGDSEETILQTLNEWIQQSRPTSARLQYSELSGEECSTRLMELSSECQDRVQVAPWPFIKAIKVFLNTHILKTGLVLVDLPGLRDLNSARQNITERYLLNCNEVLVICPIGRAATDEGVRNVFQLAQQTGRRNIGIVCTRSEDIQAEEAVRDFGSDRAAAIRRMQDAVDTDERDLQRANDELNEYQTDDEASDQDTRLLKRLRSIKRRTTKHALELKSFMMHSRNDSVTRLLQEQYKDQVPGGDIKVFCVSNLLYWDNREKARSTSVPLLELSGIIEARKYCLSIVASSQRRAARHFIDDQIPDFLAQLDHWVQSGSRSGSAERREAIRQTIHQVESRLTRSLTSRTSLTNVISATAERDFNEKIYDRRRISEWTRSSEESATVWSGWAPATYSAFCRNYGAYMTAAQGRHDWNAEAMSAMVGDLAEPWRNLISSTENRQNLLTGAITNATDAAIEGLGVAFEDNPDAPESLTDMLANQQRMLLNAVKQAQESFDEDLSAVRVDALSSIRSSLTGRALELSYYACQQENGRGSDRRRKAIMVGALSNEALFRKLMTDFRALFGQKVSNHQESVTRAVSSYVEIVRLNFDLVRDENAVVESMQDPEFRNRVIQAVHNGRESSRRSRNALDV